MSSMQLRNRNSTTTATTRKALGQIDENATAVTRASRGAKAAATAISTLTAAGRAGANKTNLVGKTTSAAAVAARTALGDLSNKITGAGSHPTKITKPVPKGTRSGPNSQKKKTSVKNHAIVEKPKESSATKTSNKLNEATNVLKSINTNSAAAGAVRKAKKIAAAAVLVEENEKEPLLKKANVSKESAEFAASVSSIPKPVFKNTKENALRQVETFQPTNDILAPPSELEETEEQYWDDLDAADAGDHLMVSEYVVDIFKYMAVLEKETMPSENYIVSQKELSWRMRSILVDWLIDIHHKFRLLPETLYLAVNLMDRFLSLRSVSLVKLQLVGIAALFIASKYEEVVHPSIKNFLCLADNGYNEDEILKAERYVLQVLNFSLQYPNPMNFLRRISKAEDYDIQTRTLGKYLMEITLVDNRFIKYPPSLIAAAAAYLSRTMLHRAPVWDNNLRYYSGGYKEEDIIPVVTVMIDYLSKPIKYEAVYLKYSSKKFMKCSIFVKDWIERKHSSSASSGERSNKVSGESVFNEEESANSEEQSSDSY